MFYFIDYFLDIACKSEENKEERMKNSVIDYERTSKDHIGSSIFSLFRSEAMGYIGLASVPFCNASRYYEMIEEDSAFFDRSQTVNRVNY